jgi:hypothetical protein
MAPRVTPASARYPPGWCAPRPAFIKGFLGRFENLAARFLSFLFGTTDHGSKTSNRMFGMAEYPLNKGADFSRIGSPAYNFKPCDVAL